VSDFLGYLFAVFIFGAFFAFAFRNELRAYLRRRRDAVRQSQAVASAAQTDGSKPEPFDQAALTARLYELDKEFAPFGSNAAHPSDLFSKSEFLSAVRLFSMPDVPFDFVMQFVEGNSWSLASAALAALNKRPGSAPALDRIIAQCEHFSPWAMYFALEFLVDCSPLAPVGAPLTRAQEWWIDNRWMPNVFRDYLARRSAQSDAATFGNSLNAWGVSSSDTIKKFLLKVTHPFATTLIGELDSKPKPPSTTTAAPVSSTLRSIGRFWKDQQGLEILIEPEGWRKEFALAESALRQSPERSLLISGEPLVGKSSFLRLLARRLAGEGWTVFEASGADLQANQIYIGQLEGRIRDVIEELGKSYRTIWYIPDLLQLALSGTHSGQSASMLDQIVPAIAAGRLIVWAEATPKGTARIVRLKPSLRGLFETVDLQPLSSPETLSLAHRVMNEMAEHSEIFFEADCAEVALDTASQFLGTGGLPGSALLMLKLTAVRAEPREGREISSRQVLETLSQLSGLPLSMLDHKEQLDLNSVRDFFNARVMGQDEAVEAMVERIAMLKAGMNDPGKPIGVFLFAGPTGTGKTELAKAVSEFLFGSAERMIRLDMSEFQTYDSMTKILGHNSSNGAESDSLISRVRKQPFSVILLDEFEKSHANIWDLFLQAFDEGRLTDAMGQVADLRHCLIILTSNLGATAHRSLGLGFAPQADVFTKEQVLRAISQTYRPEFQNRLDKVIVFRPLMRDLMRGILKKELAGLLDRRGLKDRAWAIEWESSALEFLLERGFSPEMGARPLKRAIDQYVVAPLAAIIVEKRFPEGEQFLFVRSDGAGIQAEFVDPDADARAADESLEDFQAPASAEGDLASLILSRRGTPAEFALLQSVFAEAERTLQSSEWEGLKEKLSEDMSSAEFWSRRDRFDTLARLALMDRVKAAMESAAALRVRLARGTRTQHPYSADLMGRLALQLHLVKDGIKDAIDSAPIELALVVEPVFDGAGDRDATFAWCAKLTQMYRNWVAKRHMQISELRRGNGAEKETPLLLISGFGAFRTLQEEAGLHVFEPSEGSAARVTARVRVAAVPLGDAGADKERKLVMKALDGAPRPAVVVRRYREQPPLVRDASGKVRTGRLDLVLGGEFDLLQALQR
jgi:ATP-dependent Clp protease ATP-binding subunit ClpC